MAATTLQPSDWVVIADGMFQFPIRADDFASSDMTIDDLRQIDDPDVYADWCRGMRMPEGMSVGSQECIDACNDLRGRGARYVDISQQ